MKHLKEALVIIPTLQWQGLTKARQLNCSASQIKRVSDSEDGENGDFGEEGDNNDEDVEEYDSDNDENQEENSHTDSTQIDDGSSVPRDLYFLQGCITRSGRVIKASSKYTN